MLSYESNLGRKSGLQKNTIIGIDLAAAPTNPTGWAVWRERSMFACQLYHDKEILKHSLNSQPSLIAIDAPLCLPAKNIMRKADRDMYKLGYPVFPPRFPAMEKLTMRAVEIAQHLRKAGFKVIEVHPTSTRKALDMPAKDWPSIQTIFVRMGLGGDPKVRVLTPHEIDAISAALTGYLYLQGKTELVGDEEEGYIVVPLKSDWRRLRL